ncbi:vWA domain-containing protein [Methylocystis sp. 9N]|uniref:VWA domain-containing protein n=1 Tax=Methylocystis borbori TaxID=3118750 RepID=A0ABU7XGW4_9HYPH
MIGAFFKDPRALSLLAALVLLALALVNPSWPVVQRSFDALAVIDITGSMNTRDYRLNDRPISRLEYAKLALRDAIKRLPCRSRLALGVFTERQPFLLFEPIEVCADFAPLDGAIQGLDWRMAWEGDSHISSGLYRAIDMARSLGVDLIFITDGHEAPPLPWSGGPPFGGRPGEVKGAIVGAGADALSPIPKFDDTGREIGFFGVDEVPHENRSGPPPPGAELREGYNARNAPFGGAAAVGVEHLSSLREAYLKELAQATGLSYRRLERQEDLAAAIEASATSRANLGARDLRPWFADAALACLGVLYLAIPLSERLRLRRERREAALSLNLRRSK